MRELLGPEADLRERVIPVTRELREVWFRIHKSGSPAVQFGKFPHHRFSHPKCPFDLAYLGATIQTCLWEIFGDDLFQGKRVIAAGKWNGCQLSQIIIPGLKVCAVSLERTRDAMNVDKASLLAADLSIPQEWGREVQEHPAGFEAIRYSSRFLDQPCLTLFDRAGIQSRLQVKTLGVLSQIEVAVDWLDERKAALV
jgi:hypothetical protein